MLNPHTSTEKIKFFIAPIMIVLAVFGFLKIDRAEAVFNQELNYQGKLTDASNQAIPDGNYNMVFMLYTASSGGSPIWTETATSGTAIAVTSGLFSHMLGSIESLAGVDFNQTLYLAINVDDDGEMTPRKKIGAAPAAFESLNAENSAKLDNLDSLSFLRSDAPTALSSSSASTLFTVTQSGTGDIVNFKDGSNIVFKIADGGDMTFGSVNPMLYDNSTGYLGIGTATPPQLLTVGTSTYFSVSGTGAVTLANISNPIIQTYDNAIWGSANKAVTIQGGTAGDDITLDAYQAPASAGYQNIVSGESGLVSYWKMDNDWTDSEGSNDGTRYGSGAATGTAKYGSSSGNFNGSDDYVDLSTFSFGGGTSSVEFWYKAGDSTGALNPIIGFGRQDNNGVAFYIWDNDLYYSINTTWGVQYPHIQNEWVHVVGEYDGTFARLYMNGVEVASSSAGAAPDASSDNNIFGGMIDPGPSQSYFTGNIDELAVYNIALSETQIENHYNEVGGTPGRGAVRIKNSGDAYADLYVNGNIYSDNLSLGTTSSSALFTLQGTSSSALFNIVSSTTASALYLANNGYLGIGSSTPNYLLSVGNNFSVNSSGNISTAGTLSVTGQTTLGNASTTNLTVASNSYLGTVQSGTWNGSAIGTQYGGTGQNFSEATIGNILYFSGTGALSTLAPSAGGLLLSNGAAAPSWVASTTFAASSHTQAASTITTGTFASGDYTFPASVFFANGSTYKVDSNGNGVFLNATTSILSVTGTTSLAVSGGYVGIGTANPGALLDVNGIIRSTAIQSTDGMNEMSLTATGLGSEKTMDYMEYSTDSSAQSTYAASTTNKTYGSNVLTGGTISADQSGDGAAADALDGNTSTFWQANYLVSAPHWWKYDLGEGVTKVVTKLAIMARDVDDGGHYGIKDFEIQGSNNDSSWTTLYSDTAANTGSWQYFYFNNTTAYRYYRIYIYNSWHDPIHTDYANIMELTMHETTGGDLYAYSEATIKNQGSYALKGVASSTDSLNNTLTGTISPAIDLSDYNLVKFDIRTSRTGSNIKISIHDSGGTTSSTTPNIAQADTYQTVTWDISGVSNVNKDAIDQIIVTITNADSANTFYIDNMYAAGGYGNDLAFNTNSTERLRINSSGLVGIGTTTPSALLTLYSSSTPSNNFLQIATSTNSQIMIVGSDGHVGFGTTTNSTYDVTIGGSLYATDIYTSSSTFYMNGNPVLSQGSGLLIYNGSNVGAGFKASSSLTQNLSWYLPTATGTSGQLFASDGTGNLYWADSPTPSQWTTTGSDIYYTTGKTAIGTSTDLSAMLTVQGTSTNALLNIISSTTLSAMYIANDGKVGIGTAAPGSFRTGSNDLVVGTTSGNHGISIISGSDSLGMISFGYTTGTGDGNGSNRFKMWYDATNEYFRLQPGAALVSNPMGMTLNLSGYVGIGTTTPTEPLSVVATTDVTGIRLSSSATNVRPFISINHLGQSTNDAYIGGLTFFNAGTVNARYGAVNNGATNTGALVFETNNAGSYSEKMRITGAGNVGIGTTTPDEKLDVNGRLHLEQSSAPASTADKLYNVAGALFWGDTNLSSGSSKWTFTGSDIYRMSNVGIGTTTPGHPLTVQSIDSGAAAIMVIGRAIGSQEGTINFYNNNGTTHQGQIQGTNAGSITITGSGGTGGLTVISGGYVGIGTTSPAAPLAIQANNSSYSMDIIGRSSGNIGTIQMMNNAYNTRLGYIQFGSSDGTEGNATLQLTTGSNAGFNMNGSGYVGVGTTSPQTQLHVYASPESTISVAGYRTADETIGTIAFRNEAIGGADNRIAMIYANRSGANNSGFLNFITYNAGSQVQAMRIMPDGKIGIGTTTPTAKLFVYSGASGATADTDSDDIVVGSNANAGISILTPNTSWGQLYFGDPQDYNVGGIAYNHNNDTLFFRSNDSANMVINSSGNVGIGTTSPSGQLHISGDNTTINTQLWITDTAAGGRTWRVGPVSSHSTFDIRDQTALATRLTIDSSGNVGIGMSPTSYKVDVAGSLNAQEIRVNGSVLSPGTGSNWSTSSDNIYRLTGNVGIGLSSPQVKLHVVGANGDTQFIRYATNDYAPGSVGSGASFRTVAASGNTASVIQAFTAGNSAVGNLVLNSDGGYVGIGTTSPEFTLHVKANGAATGPVFDAYDTGTTNHAFVVRDSSLNQLFRIETNGKVGIGTTSPGFKLDVNGTLHSTYLYLDPNEGDLDWGYGTGSRPLIRGNLANNSLALWTSSSPRLFIDSSGYVGIGTTSPSAALDIQKAVGAIAIQSTTGTNGAYIDISNTGGHGYFGRQSSAGNSLFSSGGLAYSLGIDSSGTNPLQFGVNDAVAMTIINGGNVGIGTTNPYNMLTVGAYNSASSTVAKQSLFSVDNMQLSQLEGGAYFGRVGIKENQWGLNNYGNTWTAKDSYSDLRDIAVSSDGKIQAAINNSGYIYVSTDYGNTWTAKATSSTRQWRGVAMSSDGKIQTAVVNNGFVYVSYDYGNTWTEKNTTRVWKGVAMSSDGKIQTAFLDNGYIYISSDYGANWTSKDQGRTWEGLAMSSDGKIQTAVVNNGQIYVSSDYGNTWTVKDSSRNWYDVAVSSDGKIQTAVNYNGYIYTSTDYGATWATSTNSGSRYWYEVAISSDGKIQTAVVDGGQIYISTDFGVNWTAKDSSRAWRAVAMSSDGKIQAAVVWNNAIYVSTAESHTYGNLGIGTTSPLALLDVYGDMILEGSDRYINFGTATSSGGYGFRDSSGTLQFKNSGGSWTAFGTGSGSGGGWGATGSLAYYSSASTTATGTTGLYWNETNDRLGIGTSSPSQSLTIGSNNQFTVSSLGFATSSGLYNNGLFTVTGDTTLANATTTNLYVGGNLNALTAIQLNGTTVVDSSRNLTNIGTIISGLVNGQTISSAANLTGTLTVAGNTILATNGGYVGIGTTTPTSALSVVGKISIFDVPPAGLTISYSGGVDLTSTTTSYGEVKAVFASGSLAYVGTKNATNSQSGIDDFQIYDISSPSSPTLIGGADIGNSGGQTSYGAVNSIFVLGDYAYLGVSHASSTGLMDFMIYDISSSTNPVFISGVDLVYSFSVGVSSVYASGTLVYIGTRDATSTTGTATDDFQIYDVSDPYNPVLKGGISFGSFTSGSGTNAGLSIKIVGANAYIASRNTSDHGNQDFLILDVSSSTNPTYLGGVDLSTNRTESVDISGNYAYIGLANASTSNQDIVIIDISSSTNPTYVSGVDLGLNSVNSVNISGDYVYVGTQNASTSNEDFQVYNISDPESPSYVDGFDVGANTVNSVSISGNYLYIGTLNATSNGEEFQSYYLDPGEPTPGEFEASKLTIAGTSTLYNVLPAANLTYSLGSSASRWNELWVGTANIGTSTWSLTPGADGRLGIFDAASGGGNERLSILTSSGNVGIGTTSPSAKLDVWGNLNVATGSTPALFVNTASGYVGIGTTTPAAKLEVVGDVYGDSFKYRGAPSSYYLVLNGTSELRQVNANLGMKSPNIYGYTDDNTGINMPGSDILYLVTGGSNRLAVDNNGLVAIGTTSPSAKLTVWGTGTGSNILANFVNSASTTVMSILENGTFSISGTSTLATTTVNGNLTIGGSGRILAPNGTAALPAYSFSGLTNAGIYNETGDANTIGFSASGAIRFQVWPSGINVRVAGTAGAPSIVLNNTSDGFFSGGTGVVGISVSAVENSRFTAGAFQASKGSADTVSYAINSRKSRGTVASPSAISTGDDLLTLSGYGYVGGTNTYVEAAKILFDSEGTITDSTTGIGGVLSFQTRASGGALTEQMRITSSGLVGIGTTSPASRLDVTGISTEGTLGSEIITNSADRDFSSDLGHWATSSTWMIYSGRLYHATSSTDTTSLPNAYLSSAPAADQTYQISFTVYTDATSSATNNVVYFGGSYVVTVGKQQGIENQTTVVTAANTNPLTFTPNSSWTGYIDNISIKLVNTNNAVQVIRNSNNSIGIEMRAGGASKYNTFIGFKSGLANTDGTYNSALGYQSLRNNTTGNNNSALGYQSLRDNTTGYANTAIGYLSMVANTIGNYNSAIGYESLRSNITGGYNTAFGPQSLNNNTTGNYNTAIGMQAMISNTTGSYNSALGYVSLYGNTTGGYNNAFGHYSLKSNTTGSYNLAAGYNALYNSQYGSNNVALGYQAGYYANATSTGNVFIGANSGPSSSGQVANKLYIHNAAGLPLIYGEFDNGRIGLGTTTLTSMLDIQGTSTNSLLNIMSSTTASALYIANDGKVGIGTASPTRVLSVSGEKVAGGALNSQISINDTTAYDSSPIAGINFNLKYNAAGNSTSLGGIAVGKTNGTDGNYSGYLSLYTRNSGETTAERLRIDNSGNVGIGTTSPGTGLHLDGSGDLGRFKISTAGVNKMLMGDDSDSFFTMYNSAGAAKIYFTGGTGNSYFNNGGNVGIGTTSPGQALDVQRTGATGSYIGASQTGTGVAGFLFDASNGDYAGSDYGALWQSNDLNGHLDMGSAGGELYLQESSGGHVVVGDSVRLMSETSDAYLDIRNGSTGYTTLYNSGYEIDVISVSNGVKLTNGATSWAALSDERLKNIQGNVENALGSLAGLRTVYYNFKTEDSSVRRLGLIAQDVQGVYPEAVSTSQDGYLSVRYSELIPPIIKGIQELSVMTASNTSEILAIEQSPLAPFIKGVNGESPLTPLAKGGDLGSSTVMIMDLDAGTTTVVSVAEIITEHEVAIVELKNDVANIKVQIADITGKIAGIEERLAMLEGGQESPLTPLNEGGQFGASSTFEALKIKGGENSTVGTSTILAGEASVVIGNSLVNDNSKIFLTPRALLDQPLSVTAIASGTGFIVSTKNLAIEDIPFDWWILQTEIPAAPATEPELPSDTSTTTSTTTP